MVLKDSPSEHNPGRQIPHNPMINAGAIMTASMVYPTLSSRAARLQQVLETWRDLSGANRDNITYDHQTYLSESATADRNWCLGYMMKEKGAYPDVFKNLEQTLELYFQICSIQSTTSDMAVMASTLANGGLNPLTGKRIFSPESVRKALPLMLTCGMYDYSGQWAYEIGVPAKSGVGGCIFLSIPNVCGIAIWSPRLDAVGNSVRGVQVATKLVERVSFHNFEVFSGLKSSKFDPLFEKGSRKQEQIDDLLFAAMSNDISELTRQSNAGLDLLEADYDKRTALHIAAAEGNMEAVEFLIMHAINTTGLPQPPDLSSLSQDDPIHFSNEMEALLSPQDRWGGTPLSDAMHFGHDRCAALLKRAGAGVGSREQYTTCADEELMLDGASAGESRMLWAASTGDVIELVKMCAQGKQITIADYDKRTPLHLAASNGHRDAVSYVLAQAGPSWSERNKLLKAQDRWGSTALDDARREAHADCVQLLEAVETQNSLLEANVSKILSV